MWRFRVSPWRMDADSYRSAAAVGGSRLAGNAVAAVWDPSLTPVMVEIGVKVEEERVLEDLRDDWPSGDPATQVYLRSPHPSPFAGPRRFLHNPPLH